MAIITTFPLPDGPLIGADFVITERAALIYRMARELINDGTHGHHGDAIVTLVVAGHDTFNIMALIDDARQVAAQHLVTMEMMIS